MTPMPIFIPISGSESTSNITSNITYPSWVIGIAKIGVAIALLGFIAFLICALLYLITDDDRFGPLDRPAVYALAVCIGGIAITLIALVLMLFTGVQIIE